MEPRDETQRDEQRDSDSPSEGKSATGIDAPADTPLVIGTDNPAITAGFASLLGGSSQPGQTMAIETSQIHGPNEAFNPHFLVVPVESHRVPDDRSGAGNQEKKASKNGAENDPKNQAGHEENARKDPSRSRDDQNDDPDRSGGKPKKGEPGHSFQAPSFLHGWFLTGLVALVCGIAGAWGYSHFFGSDKSGDHKTSSKDSGSGKDSDSSENSDSDKDSDSSKSTDSSKKDGDPDKLLQAEAAWMAAVKELREAREDEKEARRSEEESRAILDFLKKKLLLVGRSGDAALTEAFWAGGPGKDVTLRQAVDAAEDQLTEAFADRPRAEASIREMLGLANLSLGEPARAVRQYERAYALREALQGQHQNQSQTADCRNQLAVAYRLSGRTTEAARLFDNNPHSLAHASALAVQGSMLLFQKKPAEAELKLRQCLAIREKIQPDDWSTYDTRSILGEALLDQKKYADAETMLLQGYEGLKQRKDAIPSTDKHQLTKAIERLVKLYDAWGKSDKATMWRNELEAPAVARES